MVAQNNSLKGKRMKLRVAWFNNSLSHAKKYFKQQKGGVYSFRNVEILSKLLFQSQKSTPSTNTEQK